jgi:adenylyltransferase/sulfurtransferase
MDDGREGAAAAAGVDGRYQRQQLIPWIGADGQRAIGGAHAVVAGCGALGCAVADILARAGVGRLTLIDRDVVEPSNLQRQTLFAERDARERRPKAEAARARIREINSGIECRAWVDHLCAENAPDYLSGASVLIDGLDNIRTRFLLNDVAVRQGVPYIYGGAVGTEGRAMPVLPNEACLRCIFPEPFAGPQQPTCDTAGVLMSTVLAVAARQATLALQWMSGRSDQITRSIWSFDAVTGRTSMASIASARDPNCVCCGQRNFEFLGAMCEEQAIVLCGRNAVQIVPAKGMSGAEQCDPELLRTALAPHGTFEVHGARLVGTMREVTAAGGGAIELTVFSDGRAIVGGTTDPIFARSVYDRFIGRC